MNALGVLLNGPWIAALEVTVVTLVDFHRTIRHIIVLFHHVVNKADQLMTSEVTYRTRPHFVAPPSSSVHWFFVFNYVLHEFVANPASCGSGPLMKKCICLGQTKTKKPRRCSVQKSACAFYKCTKWCAVILKKNTTYKISLLKLKTSLGKLCHCSIRLKLYHRITMQNVYNSMKKQD